MHYPEIDDPPKSHISPRVLRLIRHSLLKLRPYFRVLFCNKQENYSVSLWLCVRFWLRLCLPCQTFVALVSLGARPTPLNHVLPLAIFLSFLLTPLHSCNASNEISPTNANLVSLIKGWDNENFKNWGGNFSKGDVNRDNILLIAGQSSTAVPTVRKKILRKSESLQAPQTKGESDQPLTDRSGEKRPIPKPPTGLSIVASERQFATVTIPTLPEGNNGLAGRYPGDEGIEKDPNVIFIEKFDDGPGYEILTPVAMQLIFSRWDTVKGKENMSLSNDVPKASADDRSLLITHKHGQESGYLYRRLLPGYDKVFVRYYVKFDPKCAPIGHFGAWIGGYNPPTPWPQGGAGAKPAGRARFTTGVEPYGNDWAWDFYTYWQGMHAHGDGKYWGTTFLVDGSKPPVEKGKWICVETMLQINDPVAASNGSQAFWIDGKLFRRDGQIVSHFGAGFPKGEWTGGWWKPDAKSDSTFEGFQWRNIEDLAINFLWIQAYQPKTPQGMTSKIWIDNIVVANEYIGPISSR